MRKLFLGRMARGVKVEDSLYSKLNPRNIRLDYNVLEELFQAKAPSTKAAVKAAPKRVAILSNKRSNNVCLLLRSFKAPLPAIRDAIMDLDDGLLTADRIKDLLKAWITPEEERELDDYMQDNEGDAKALARLGEAEQFFVLVANIPNVHQRLTALQLQLEFGEKVQEISEKLELNARTVEAVRSSEALEQLLEIILAIASFVNQTWVKALPLASLLKLKGTKAANGRQHLLHYIQSFVEERYPGTEKAFLTALEGCNEASKVGVAVLQADYNRLRKDVRAVESQLATVPATDVLKDKLGEFVERATTELNRIEPLFSLVEKGLTALCAKLGEKETPSEELFGILDSFAQEWQLSARQNAQQRERDAAKKRKAAHKLRMAARRASKKAIELKLTIGGNKPPASPREMEEVLKSRKSVGDRLKAGPKKRRVLSRRVDDFKNK